MAVYTIPNTISSGNPSVFSHQQIAEWLEGLPDGASFNDPTIALFGAGVTYYTTHRIVVTRKTNFVIHLNGSTFNHNPIIDGQQNGSFALHMCVNTRIHGGTIRGNFHLNGVCDSRFDASTDHTQPNPTRNQGTVNNWAEEMAGWKLVDQPKHGIGIYGGDGVWVTDCDVGHVFGDGYMTGQAHMINSQFSWENYIEVEPLYNTPGDPNSGINPDVTVKNVYAYDCAATKCARHGMAPCEFDGFWADNFELTDCWYAGLDAEADQAPTNVVRGLRLTNGRFFQNAQDFVYPVATLYTDDIKIQGVKFDGETTVWDTRRVFIEMYNAPETHPDPNVANPNYVTNVLVEGCSFVRYGLAVTFGNVNGAIIRDNKDIPSVHPFAGDNVAGYPFYRKNDQGPDRPSRAINITESNNTTSVVPPASWPVTRVPGPPLSGAPAPTGIWVPASFKRKLGGIFS